LQPAQPGLILGVMLRIWTLGHSTLEFAALLGLLRQHRIMLLADVRSYPGSRRCPQFNRTALQSALPAAGIAYRHFAALGGRRQTAKGSRNAAWRNSSFRGYADYMETNEFQAGMAELASAAAQQPTALMCAEALWWRCHRALIADALKFAGYEVLHIASGGGLTVHPFTSAASIVDGRLSYRGENDQGARR